MASSLTIRVTACIARSTKDHADLNQLMEDIRAGWRSEKQSVDVRDSCRLLLDRDEIPSLYRAQLLFYASFTSETDRAAQLNLANRILQELSTWADQSPEMWSRFGASNPRIKIFRALITRELGDEIENVKSDEQAEQDEKNQDEQDKENQAEQDAKNQATKDEKNQTEQDEENQAEQDEKNKTEQDKNNQTMQDNSDNLTAARPKKVSGILSLGNRAKRIVSIGSPGLPDTPDTGAMKTLKSAMRSVSGRTKKETGVQFEENE